MESIGKQLQVIIARYEKKEYDAAEKAADELLAAFQDFQQGHFMKAVILEETGRAGDAEKHYEMSGNRFTLWSRLALQLHEIDPQRALIYYERVTKADPRNNLLWFNLGNLYEAMGKREDARRCFRNLTPLREVLSRIIIPLGFLIFLTVGAVLLFQRGERALTIVVSASAFFCLFWLKRDAGKAVQMVMKKKKYA